MLKICYTSLFCLLIFSVHAQQWPNKNLGIIPAPASVSINKGTFDIRKITAIVYLNEVGSNEAKLLRDYLQQRFKLNLTVEHNLKKGQKNAVIFSPEYTGTNAEGYQLNVANTGVSIIGKKAGLFYGLQSFLQIIDAGADGVIPCATIIDEPRYPYRGIMQDVGYHIFPPEFIKKQIDMMSKYKLNTYHWHLTEDHGWRIEIMKYPKLTEIGSIRAQSPVNNYRDEMSGLDNTPYGGYYTQAQIKEIVAYATEKHITIIPEIELPGHSLAALAAYPELACGDHPGPFKVAEHWGIYDDVYCAGKDHVFEFLENVLSEVIDLFPGKYIHIGGDECPKDRWEKCKYCQERIKDNHLNNEHELQSYFVSRISKFLNKKGRHIIGWDEILEGGLSPDATVMSWRGIAGGVAAAKQGHDVVMASESHLYFDFIQGPREQEPLAIGLGYNSLSRVYSFDPTPEGLTPEQQKHILGPEAPLWTEHMETPGNVEYMLYPRLFALAEIGWSPVSRKDFIEFEAERLPKHLLSLDRSGIVYRVPTPIGQKDTVLWGKEFDLTLNKPVEGATIYYNFEGQEPRESDYQYKKPLHIYVPEGEMRELKTIVVAPSGKRSIVTTTTFVNKPYLDPIQLNQSDLEPGLKYYLVPGKYQSTETINIEKAKQTGVVLIPDLEKFGDVADRNVVYKGYINIAADDVYTFSMPSKGADVRINGHAGVRNSNIYNYFDLINYHHQERTISYALKKGLHEIEIRYIPLDAGHRVMVRSTKGNYRELSQVFH